MTVLDDMLGSGATVRVGVNVVHTFITIHRVITLPGASGLARLRGRMGRLGSCVRRIFTSCGSVGSSAQVRLRLVGRALTRLRTGGGLRRGPHEEVKFVRRNRWSSSTGRRVLWGLWCFRMNGGIVKTAPVVECGCYVAIRR